MLQRKSGLGSSIARGRTTLSGLPVRIRPSGIQRALVARRPSRDRQGPYSARQGLILLHVRTSLALGALVMAGATAQAQNGFKLFGPLNEFGFPSYYEDHQGLQLTH